MRIFIALALYVSLTSGLFGQEARQTERPERKQIRRYLAEGKYGEVERTLRAALTVEPEEIEANTEFRIALADLPREEGRDPEARALFTTVPEQANLTWK